MRAFIAITLPQNIQDALSSLQHNAARALTSAPVAHSLAPLLRWSPPAQMHLTLRFLGEIDEPQRVALAAQLAHVAATSASFALTLAGLGSFPVWSKVAVLWAGVAAPPAMLMQMQERIEEAARAVGLVAEKKPWRPHLTLARVNRRATSAERRQMGEVLRRAAQQPAIATWQASFVVREIVLMRSEIHSEGARHTALNRFTLPTTSGG
jgi:2'-5' RNA ligase